MQVTIAALLILILITFVILTFRNKTKSKAPIPDYTSSSTRLAPNSTMAAADTAKKVPTMGLNA